MGRGPGRERGRTRAGRTRGRAQGRTAGTVCSVLAVLALTVATGCGPAATEPPSGAPPARDTAPEPDAPPSPAPPPSPELPPTPDPPPDAGRPPNACDAPTEAGIAATVSRQLDAFADADLAGAYATTSPFFRRFVDEEAFAALISDEYPELLDNDGHRTDGCLAVGRRGSLIVGVRDGGREVVLRYDLSREEDGWLIDGARRLVGVTLPPQPLA